MARVQERADGLIDGVPASGVARSRLRVPGLTRTAIARLLREGYDTAEALRELPGRTGAAAAAGAQAQAREDAARLS